jgi:hypothetical protein
MGRAISIGVSSPVVVLPCCIVIDCSSFCAGFCDSHHEEKLLNRAAPSGLPFYLRSACRAQSTPALRTHALLSKIRYAPL